ncbi:hypothetical protein LCGC14_2365780 [marine sediment metagenome]|uniref:Uncharacterized protein n=1 Tax=marine sediment metagenome TaxID=412755 RepID=A0A0F9F013_9ZZZZ
MDEGMKNKRGVVTIFILVGFLYLVGGVLMLIVGGSVIEHVQEALDQNVSVGQVNFQEVADDTFGPLETMIFDNADWWGTAIIFGMVLGLFLISYFARGTFPKIAIIMDLFVIFTAFIFSLYISAIYNTLINALTDAGETFAQVYLPKTSYFILNLPLFTVLIGVIMMILFHSSIPRKSEETRQQVGDVIVP